MTRIHAVCVECLIQTFNCTLLFLSCLPFQKVILFKKYCLTNLVGKTKQDNVLPKLVDYISTLINFDL
jgi:hypothetical protein